MLTLLRSFFIKNSLSTGFIVLLAVLIVIIVVPNLDQISEKLGFETRTSLNKELVEEKQQTAEVIEANKSLDTAITVIEETQKQADTVSTSLEQQKKEVTNRKNQILEEKKKKLETVKKPQPHKPTTPDKSPTSPSVMEEALNTSISQIQIQSVWKTYCDFNQHPGCSAPGVAK